MRYTVRVIKNDVRLWSLLNCRDFPSIASLYCFLANTYNVFCTLNASLPCPFGFLKLSSYFCPRPDLLAVDVSMPPSSPVPSSVQCRRPCTTYNALGALVYVNHDFLEFLLDCRKLSSNGLKINCLWLIIVSLSK